MRTGGDPTRGAAARRAELAANPDDGALAIGNGACSQEPHELGHQLLPDRAAGLEQLGQVLNVSPRKRIDDHRHPDGPHDGARQRLSHVGGNRVAQEQCAADVQHAGRFLFPDVMPALLPGPATNQMQCPVFTINKQGESSIDAGPSSETGPSANARGWQRSESRSG